MRLSPAARALAANGLPTSNPVAISPATGFFYGGAERFKFVVRVAPVHGFGLVAGKFHPHFLRNARVCHRAIEGVP